MAGKLSCLKEERAMENPVEYFKSKKNGRRMMW
jgi:hypothetical protein